MSRTRRSPSTFGGWTKPIDGFADLLRKTEISLHRARQEVERLRAAAS